MSTDRKTHSRNLQQADGGYNSRKLLYAIGTSAAIVGLGVAAAFFPSFRASLETVVGGLCGTLAIYMGGNVSGKWAIGKAGSYGGDFGFPLQAFAAAQQQPDPRPPVEPIPEER